MVGSLKNVTDLINENTTSIFNVIGLNQNGKHHQNSISPIALLNTVPRFDRFIIMSLFTICGTFINGFFVSSFFIEKKFQNFGNTFIQYAGTSDFINTAVLMSMSSMVLLTDELENIQLCQSMQVLAVGSIYVYCMYFMIAALENYYWVCKPLSGKKKFKLLHVYFGQVLLYFACIVIAAMGVIYKYDYDYCDRQLHGNIYYRIYSAVMFHFVPGVVTIVFFCKTILKAKRMARANLAYRRSYDYYLQHKIVKLNLSSYIIFVACWIPHLIVILGHPSDKQYYYTAWIGLFRPVVSNIIYPMCSTEFRRTFIYLFNYCFCKNTVPVLFPRRRRGGRTRAETEDNRVITVQPMARLSPRRDIVLVCDELETMV